MIMKTVKICTLALAAGMVLSCAASCTKVKPTETTTDTSASSSETPSTLDTIRISEDPTEPTDSEESTGFYEKMVYTGEDETYVNTFITNFAEQYFHEMPEDGKFDVKNASVEDILTFVYFHIKINSYKDFAPGTKGECSYATFTFAKAAEVTGRYFSYLLKEEDCKNLPAPPAAFGGGQFGPYYEDGKIWFSSGDGDTYRNIGIVDYVENYGDGTLTLCFTIYNIDFDVFNNLTTEEVKKYYSLSPEEAAADKTLTRRGTGIAVVDVGQSGKYSLRTYEVKTDN